MIETSVEIEVTEGVIESYHDPRLVHRSCPVCKNDYFRTYAHCRPDNIGLPLFEPHFLARVVKCLVCGMVYTNPILSEVLSKQIYISVYANLPPPHTKLDFSAMKVGSFLLRLLRRDHLLTAARMKELFPGGGARVLDVGCNYGEFVHYLNTNGFMANGIDIIESRIHTGKSAYGIQGIMAGELESVDLDKYDIINLSHVLEHIGTLDPFLNRLIKRMKVGAYLFVSVPNFAAVRHLYHRRNLLLPYGHVNNFTYRHLVGLFDRFFMSRVELSPISASDVGVGDKIKEELNSVTSRILTISPFNLMYIGRVF